MKIQFNYSFGKVSRRYNQPVRTTADFADYLEISGTSKRMVIAAIKNHKKFDLLFSYQPENPQSLTAILAKMGLTLVNAQRKVQARVV